MNINGTFRFHHIGQGLFYSGLLNLKDSKKHDVFSFVYDCGTDSNKLFLRREIESFKPLLPSAGILNKKKINMLVISHLHDDHVNGLEHLLDDVEVDTVVMPYIDDGLKSLPLVESTDDSDFLRTFYLDPVGWFTERGVRRILLLGAEGTDTKGDDLSFRQSLNNDDSDIYVEPENVVGTGSANGTSIVYLESRSTVRCKKCCWEFKFENLKLDSALIDSYKNIVEDYIRKYHSLENILKNKQLIQDLRNDIKETQLKYTLNRTSVVMLHRPIASDAYVQFGFCNGCFHRYFMPHIHIEDILCGSILTGDVDLKEGESFDILDDSSVRHGYSVVQFPHHGAKNDYNIEYFHTLPAITTVVSYGIINRYGHPHGQVLRLLERVSPVNERQAFDYQISVFD